MIQAVADNLAIARLENGAIGEPSERIGFGLPPQAIHCLAVGGDILFGAEDPRPPSIPAVCARLADAANPATISTIIESGIARGIT